MKYIIILSLLFLAACSSQPNRCSQRDSGSNAVQQKSR